MANINEVRKAELEEITKSRKLRFPNGDEPAPELTGLCLSGGGIRSATFSLGVLQGLATYGLLRRLDYISSVSGGGYIASWLISWIKRPGPAPASESGIDTVERNLRQAPPHFKKSSMPFQPAPDTLGCVALMPPKKTVLRRLIDRITGRDKVTQHPEDAATSAAPAPPPPPQLPSTSAGDDRYEEPGAINFLRAYSNYLTPRLGFFGADTWSAVASYTRNLLLNQVILVSSLAAVILLPRFALLGIRKALEQKMGVEWAMGALAVLLLLWALTFVDLNIADFSWREAVTVGKPNEQDLDHADQKRVQWFGVLPIFAAAVIGALTLPVFIQNDPKLANVNPLYWIGGGALSYLLLRAVAQLLAWALLDRRMKNKSEEQKDSFWKKEHQAAKAMLLAAPFAGILGGILVREAAVLFHLWTCSNNPAGLAHLVSWGPPLLIAIILLNGVLHVGLMGLDFPNQKREWWARLAAWLLIATLVWAALFAVALFAPLGVLKLTGYLRTKIAALAVWIGTTLWGVLAGKSSKTSGEKGANTGFELVTLIAPYVFIVGTLILISFGIHAFVGKSNLAGGSSSSPVEMRVSGKLESDNPALPFHGSLQFALSNKSSGAPSLTKEDWQPGDFKTLILLLIVLLAVAIVLAWRVDINEFSLHLFYRNRLVRCYLGATNPARCPHPFTGFDPTDDVLLSDFSIGKDQKYSGPYPILNAALNTSHGTRLAWQERKAESFVFTPCYCGYDYQEEHDDEQLRKSWIEKKLLKKNLAMEGQGYQETKSYAYPDGGPYLGTAVAISGAAVNPNMGYHASAAVAFLLTLFNVRLGWWMGNPRRETHNRSTPRFGLFYLLCELLGITNDTSRYLNLSDGWHFENLGLYELVRRECNYIIVCDVGADAAFGREDLGNAIRKCRSDFGVEIDIDASPLRPAADGFSEAHLVVGTIRYRSGQEGRILYIKSALTGDEPQDILAYKAANPVFPHQGTGDQWFDESQFESYRALGRFAVESALTRLGNRDDVSSIPTAQLFESLFSR